MCADLSMVSANADNCLDWGLAPAAYAHYPEERLLVL